MKSKKYPRLEKIDKEFLIVFNFVDVDDFVVICGVGLKEFSIVVNFADVDDFVVICGVGLNEFPVLLAAIKKSFWQHPV